MLVYRPTNPRYAQVSPTNPIQHDMTNIHKQNQSSSQNTQALARPTPMSIHKLNVRSLYFTPHPLSLEHTRPQPVTERDTGQHWNGDMKQGGTRFGYLTFAGTRYRLHTKAFVGPCGPMILKEGKMCTPFLGTRGAVRTHTLNSVFYFRFLFSLYTANSQ